MRRLEGSLGPLADVAELAKWGRPVESPNVRYVPAVDHLRLYAALMVLVFHGLAKFGGAYTAPTQWKWPHPAHWPILLATEGSTGVTLFMVLSGFILTYAALGKHVAYGPFLRNRALRILPLLLVVFLLAVATAPGLLSPSMFWIVLDPARSPRGAGSFVDVAWSVFVELELYLMFPVFLHHLEEGGPRRMLSWIALLAGFRFAALSAGADGYSVLYFSVFARADQFILGMVAAWLLRRYSTRLWGLLTPVGLLIVVPMLASFNHANNVRLAKGSALGSHWGVLSPTLEGVGWACFLLGYVALMQRASGTVSRVLARLGATSYSIYLLHVVVISVLLDNHFRLNLGSTPFVRAVLTTSLVVVPLTLLVSRLSYSLIELPFLRRRTRWVGPAQSAPEIPLRAVV